MYTFLLSWMIGEASRDHVGKIARAQATKTKGQKAAKCDGLWNWDTGVETSILALSQVNKDSDR